MAIFTTTSRRFHRKSQHTFAGNPTLRTRRKGSIELIAADADRRDGGATRRREF